jgi:hypothetical protein
MHATTLLTTLALASIAFVNAAGSYDPVKMLCLVNKERRNNGLSPLGLDKRLESSAQKHSEDQARMRSMTHDGSDGSQPGDRVERSGFNWRSVAENVAYGYDGEEECMRQWMMSPGHRENILGRDYTHFGSAVGYSGSTPYYTQDFAGDGKSHNFPECPSGNAYGGDDQGAADYSAPSSDYSGGDSAPSSNYGGSKPSSNNYGGSKPSNNYSAPSSNYGGSKPSSGRRHKRTHKSGRKVTSYGGNVDDSNDTRYGNVDDSHAKKPYGGKKPAKSTKPAYGNVNDSHAKKPYGGKKPVRSTKPAYGKVDYNSRSHRRGGHKGSKAY